jgi:DNA invertase Pin-like site-specific DNA recombinase
MFNRSDPASRRNSKRIVLLCRQSCSGHEQAEGRNDGQEAELRRWITDHGFDRCHATIVRSGGEGRQGMTSTIEAHCDRV